MPYLIQKAAAGTPVGSWDLYQSPLRFGRGDDADVTIDDEMMSREHFVIECRDGVYWLRDLDSRNGVYLNGRRATEEQLRPNDKIVAGHSHFVLVAGLRTVMGNVEPGELEPET